MAGLGVAGRYIGVLNLESGRKYHFTDRHRRLIAQLVDCVAIALRINASYDGLRQVGHDLTSYGAALGNLTKVIAEDARDPTARSTEAVGRIRAIGNDLCNLRHDILPRQPAPEILLVQDILPDVIELVQVRDISRMAECMVLPAVVFDHDHLRRVLIHLLTNSKQALTGVERRLITIDGDLDASEGCVQIRIADNGVGMTPSQKERAFEPGYSRRAQGKKGSGFGLSFCQEIMTTGHGGIDILQTAPGVGTTVEVFFPVAAATVLVRQDSSVETVALLTDDSDWADRVQKALAAVAIGSVVHSRSPYVDAAGGHRELPVAPVVFVDLRGSREESSRLAGVVLSVCGGSRGGGSSKSSVGASAGLSQFAALVQFPNTVDLLADLVRQAVDRSKGL